MFTLSNLRHHIQTSYGDSPQSQGQINWLELVTGIGQGNGAGPQIWAAVSLPLFNIIRLEGFVAHFIRAISKEQRSLAGFAFVDNTNLIVTADHRARKLSTKCKSCYRCGTAF